MRFYRTKTLFVEIFYSCCGLFILAGCAGPSHKSDIQSKVKSSEKYVLALKGVPQRKEKTSWYTEIHTSRTDSQQIERTEIEKMRFVTQVKTLAVNDQEALLYQQQTTLSKSADMNLHEMAFAELNEKLNVTLKPNGEVVKAGNYPQNSIFYVPSISLPSFPVSTNEPWELKKSWVDPKIQLEFKIHLISHLNQVLSCGTGRCFDIKLEGDIEIPGLKGKAEVSGKVWGRFILSEELGLIVWSDVHNGEKISISGENVAVETCLESVLLEPKLHILKNKKESHCQPVGDDGEISLPEIIKAEIKKKPIQKS